VVNYHAGMTAPPPPLDWTTPRPLESTYWVVPGRLLVGEHPGSRSRAQSMERLRRFLEAGVTCFIDLTEPGETPAYEMLLPFETPAGQRVEYLREPITDHGVPADRETMGRVLAMLDGALDTGHLVYLHCRAGIGRSAMAAGCWLAERNAKGGAGALDELASAWQQAAQARYWPQVPETEEQAEFVRSWQALPARRPLRDATRAVARSAMDPGRLELAQRVRGGWFGLALGDALGGLSAVQAAGTSSPPLAWGQHTALSLCLADSLAASGRCDPRDQIERYWRWFRQGEHDARGEPGVEAASPEVARALATYRWRGQPRAGSHDPKEVSAGSLSRVLAAVLHAGRDPARAIALAAECSRTTHQSPVILDACRLYAALQLGVLQGHPAASWLEAVPEPAARCWGTKPLRKDVRATLTSPHTTAATDNVLQVLAATRHVLERATSFEEAMGGARAAAKEDAALVGSLVGTLFGLAQGFDALPAGRVAQLAGAEQLERAAAAGLTQLGHPGGGA
jgi:ADP-ribosylglycohydrolase